LGIAKQLVRDAGFEPVIAGSLEEGRAFDPGTPYYATNVRASDLRRAMADKASAEKSERAR
jgi:predicted dinucleotide-binding enzyme